MADRTLGSYGSRVRPAEAVRQFSSSGESTGAVGTEVEASGQVTSKRLHTPIMFRKHTDKATPLLIKASCTTRRSPHSSACTRGQRHGPVVSARVAQFVCVLEVGPTPSARLPLQWLGPALVAQWIEHLTTDQKVGRSSPPSALRSPGQSPTAAAQRARRRLRGHGAGHRIGEFMQRRGHSQRATLLRMRVS